MSTLNFNPEEKVQECRDKLGKLLSTLFALEQGKGGERADLDKSRLHKELMEVGWEAFTFIALSGISNHDYSRLHLDPAWLDSLDFGLFGLSPGEAEIRQQLGDLSFTGDPSFEVLRFSDYLSHHLREMSGLNKEKELLAKRDRIFNSMEVNSERLIRVKNVLTRLEDWFIPLSAQQSLKEVHGEINKHLTSFLTKKKILKTRSFTSKEERDSFLNLQHLYQKLVSQFHNIISHSPCGDKLVQLNQKIETINMENLDIYRSFVEIDEKLGQLSTERLHLDPTKIANHLKGEISIARILSFICSKRARTMPMPLPLTTGNRFTTRPLIDRALSQIVSFDHNLMSQRHLRKQGFPRLVILPGNGKGIYDYQKHMIFLPSLPQDGPLPGLAYAVALLHLDLDRIHNEEKLMASYKSSITNNRGMLSKVVRDRFVVDYVIWITKESLGYSIFDRETAGWFEANIAPDKNCIIIPNEFRHLSLLGMSRTLLELDTTTYHGLYSRAVLSYLSGKLSESARDFSTALPLSPDSAECLYNLGFIYKRMMNKKESKKNFSEFIEKRRLSWWVKKAKEHMTSLY